MLKVRKVGGQEILSLFDEINGAVALPRDWTDQTCSCPLSTVLEEAPILHPACLLKLQELIGVIQKRIDDAK